ncbi:MAG: exo-beta-N-acetylmuramidase NamZ domain-containing protein [Bacteroidales bacterium]
MRLIVAILAGTVTFYPALSQDTNDGKISTGAEQVQQYLPRIHGKRVAVVTNHTSLVGRKHLVDTLLILRVNIKKIFCPEHGFRGDIEAGELIRSHTDTKTGLPVISLYGSSKKPSKEQLKDIDIVLFDMQDVGVRYYTYISTMHYVMEACAENGIPLIVLDRPNPNGFYVDGPVLDTAYRSFVGMHPVPLVHGMTVGEFAMMINGEGWLLRGQKCDLTVVPSLGYTHGLIYSLPVKPSPNLPNLLSVLLYPSLGLFEGTVVSVGRGTNFPFQVFGYPGFPGKDFKFKPTAVKGASANPPYKGKCCFGIDLRGYSTEYFINRKSVNLEWLIFAYQNYPDKKNFFNGFFLNLAGTPLLRKQMEEGLSADSIRNSWGPSLQHYKQIRKNYLLYPDFE